MGASQTHHAAQYDRAPPQRVYFTVQLNGSNQFHSAAEPLTGRVVLFVDEDFFVMQTLTVRFYGQETSSFVSKFRMESYEGPSQTFVNHHNENEKFASMSATLYDTSPSGRLDRGYYEFPFAFVLPPNLPGSAASVGLVSFTVQYFVEAQCWTAASEVARSQFVALQLQQPPPPPPSSPLRSPITSGPVSSYIPWCGCFAGGKLSIAVRLPDSHVAVGLPFAIDIAYRNFSYATLREVTVLIKEYVSVGRAPTDASCTTVLVRMPVAAVRFPPSTRPRMTTMGSLSQHQEYSAVTLVHDALTSQPALHVPVMMNCPPARSSVAGRVGRVSHTLEVVADVGAFAPLLIVELPLTIYDTRPRVLNGSPSVSGATGVALPEGWAPVVAPVVTIDSAPTAASPGATAEAPVVPTAPSAPL